MASCRGTLGAAQPTATIRFAVDGFDKVLFVAEAFTDCRVRFALFKDGDDTPLLDDRPICELQATPVDIGQRDYSIRLTSAEPTATVEYALLMGGLG
ncbi:hypothetical protein [Yinghuangia sp. YIM S10712]|uniref:hypothetical protein n=1 Tax=Yinghuangia sp. YIM S10712 TaxID=3436930 RepID=UPI003F531F12